MGFLLAAAIYHNNIRNGQAVSPKTCGPVVGVERAVNILQRGLAVQRGRVDKFIVFPVHGQPCGLQFLIGPVTEVAPFRASRHLIDGKGVSFRLVGATLGQCLFRPFPHILPQRQRIEGGHRGKAHVVKHIVHIGFFQGSRCEVVCPRGGVAHLAVCNIMAQSRFQMGADFSVHGQRHIVPADIAAGLLVGPVVKLHIQQRVGL